MHPDSAKWNARYQHSQATPQPCALLNECRFLLPHQGTALDLACGMGGNALLLAQQGLQTDAWDIADIAIDRLQQRADQQQLPIRAQVRDVESQPPHANRYDCIVVSYFLDRALCPALIAALKPGGLLFYQTFSADKLSDKGPSNPDFLLQNNELLTLFSDLEVRFYRELRHCGDTNIGDRNTVQLIAQKPQ